MKRIRTLDTLKFIMALLIAFHHYQQHTGMRGTYVNFYDGKIYWGSLVEMFFIISGFLAARGMDRTAASDFKDYIIGKVIRIYPMAMISVAVTTAAGFVYVAVFGHWFAETRLTLWKIFNSMLLTVYGGAVKDGWGINGALWYLGVLIYCYILFYFIIWISGRFNINRIYGFILISIIGLSTLQYEVSLPFLNEYSARGYAAFFLGVILFYIWDALPHRVLMIYSAVMLFVCAVVYFGAYSLFAANMRDVFTYMIFPALLYIALGLDTKRDSAFTDRLEPGGVAFEIYVWHGCGICVWMILSKVTGLIDINNYYRMFVYALILTVFSFFMYHCVEKKIVKYLKERFTKA